MGDRHYLSSPSVSWLSRRSSSCRKTVTAVSNASNESVSLVWRTGFRSALAERIVLLAYNTVSTIHLKEAKLKFQVSLRSPAKVSS